jgi:hypothetical protein
MKRYLSIVAVLAVIVVVIFAIGACQGSPFAARSVPVLPAPPGDSVSKTYGGTFDDAVAIVAPTANATADTALYVNNLSVAQPFVVAQAGTPVFSVGSTGAVSGKALSYDTTGSKIVCGSQTITDTATAVHGLTTPVYAWCNLPLTSPDGDAVACFSSISSSTVTVKVRDSALTPAANSAGVVVQWCVLGTP